MRLPDFIIGGAPRSGTTWLYQVLSSHPQVYMAKPVKPEPKFFLIDEIYANGLTYYGHWFEPATENQIAGEKSTNYLENATVARRIREAVPSVKLLFLLRDPVQRAWSNYLWSKMNGLETLAFEDALAAEEERERNYPPKLRYARPYAYRSRGLYAQQLLPYFSLFAREQILCLRFEDIETDASDFVARIHRFLGVVPRPKDALGVHAVNMAENEDSMRMTGKTQRQLQHFYREPNLRLQELLGNGFPAWKYTNE
jgi:hypothetical protein